MNLRAHRGAIAAAAALTLAPGIGQAAEPITAIVGATVVRVEREGTDAVAPDTTVIIVGSRIRAVGPAGTTAIPKNATRIDGKGKWVIAGLVDSHVHFFQSGNIYTRPDVADFNAWMPYERETRRNKSRLPATFKVWLASGVTSVADVGGPFWNFDVRDRARKSGAAPRVAVAGPLVSMVDRVKLDLGDPPIIRVTSPDEARTLVRRELSRKPDFVKVWFIHRLGDDLAAQEAIVRAAAEEAHAAGVRLAVHATELVTAKAALRVGADILVHSVEDAPVDDEFLELAKRNGAIYCPTLFVTSGYQLALSNTWTPTDAEKRLADPEILKAMRDLQRIPRESIPERVRLLMAQPPSPKLSAVAAENLRKVWDAGITVAMGTDAGNVGTLHGPSVFREMELMVQAGLTPLQVLRSATLNGAKTLGLQHELGTVEPGKLADLVVLDADPLADIANASRIHRVVKGGRAYTPASLMRSIAPR